MSESPKEKKSLDGTIVAAIITGIVTIAVTAITVFGGRQSEAKPELTMLPIVIEVTATTQPTAVPTDTVPAGDPSWNPTPTDMPAPTPTDVPVLSAGADWLQGCISAVWTLYPDSAVVPDAGGCYSEPLGDAFSAREQQLVISVDKNVSEVVTEVVGIFTEIPNDSLVDLFIRLNTIDTGQLWIGVFAEKNVQSKGFLVVVPDGNKKKANYELYEMPNSNRRFISDEFTNNTGEYQLTFNVTPSDVSGKLERYVSLPSVNVSSDKKYLFIGYQTITGKTNRVVADLFSLLITPR